MLGSIEENEADLIQSAIENADGRDNFCNFLEFLNQIRNNS